MTLSFRSTPIEGSARKYSRAPQASQSVLASHSEHVFITCSQLIKSTSPKTAISRLSQCHVHLNLLSFVKLLFIDCWTGMTMQTSVACFWTDELKDSAKCTKTNLWTKGWWDGFLHICDTEWGSVEVRDIGVVFSYLQFHDVQFGSLYSSKDQVWLGDTTCAFLHNSMIIFN